MGNPSITPQQMARWSTEEHAAYLSPESTMAFDEFDHLLTAAITDLWQEKYGADK